MRFSPRFIASLGALAVAFAAALVPAGSASAARNHATGGLYLALGDSLAAGYQPTFGNSGPPVDPATHTAVQGYPGGYARDIAAAKGLALVDLACPGETTSSMTAKPAQAECRTTYHAIVGANSQLAAAKAFLARYAGKVKLVTLDLGANNVDGCASSSSLNVSCLASGEASIVRQLPAIVNALRAELAAKDPGSALVAMNYYDPFLGIAYSPGGALASAGATLSVGETTTLNASLALIYGRAHVPVADVAGAFATASVRPLSSYGGKRLPYDVYNICRWTWMCPLPKAKIGANIHANTVGYAVIAKAFERAIPASVP